MRLKGVRLALRVLCFAPGGHPYKLVGLVRYAVVLSCSTARRWIRHGHKRALLTRLLQPPLGLLLAMC